MKNLLDRVAQEAGAFDELRRDLPVVPTVGPEDIHAHLGARYGFDRPVPHRSRRRPRSANESLTGRIVTALRSNALLNESPGAGYLDRQWPQPFKESGAWPLKSLRQAFLSGAMERLLDVDAYLKAKIPDLAISGWPPVPTRAARTSTCGSRRKSGLTRSRSMQTSTC